MATLEQAYKMAHEAYTKHDYQRAESVCVQILNQVDGHPETRYLLGHIKKNRRQIDEAREIFEGLLRDDTKNPDILCSLGTLEETVGRYDTALSFFKRALDINANLETAQFLYASMLERTNQIIKPLYPDSRQRWKNYENYIAPHIDSLLPYIEKFGYKEE